MHPNKARVRRLGSVGPGKLAMAVEGNNELGIWDVESSSRQKKVVSNSSVSEHCVTCFSVLSKDKFITGGTDSKLRSWQIYDPKVRRSRRIYRGAVNLILFRHCPSKIF